MKLLAPCLALMLLLPACVKPVKRRKLNKLTLSMSKEQVTKMLGKPKIFVGSVKNKFNQVIEVFEYDVDTGKSSAQIATEIGHAFLIAFCGVWVVGGNDNQHIKPFWFYFHNNGLVKWGAAGEWRNESNILTHTELF